MATPANLRYTKDHEWISIEGNTATIGITDFAQGELGDIVFVDISVQGKKLGAGKKEFDKEQKQDLMHIAICTLLAQSGYYVLSGRDEDGWPHFTQLKALPPFNLMEQENFLKDHVLLYFDALMK